MPIATVARTQQFVFGALAASILIYGVVVVVAAKGEPVPLDPMLRWILAGVSVMTSVAVLVLRRARLPPLAEDESPYQRQNAPPPVEVVPEAVVAKLFTTYILTWALSESIAIYGVVLAFLSQSPKEFWPFGFAALLLILTNPPTRGRLESATRAAQ